MTQTGAVTVRKQIVVDTPIERAFSVFTGRFGDFKPPEHNMLGAPITETVFEPLQGIGGGTRWLLRQGSGPPNTLSLSLPLRPRSPISASVRGGGRAGWMHDADDRDASDTGRHA
jgi:hypothetical protein